MSESEYQKLKHDLLYLISVSKGSDKVGYEKQLRKLEKSR